jgi:hypothetical protein
MTSSDFGCVSLIAFVFNFLFIVKVKKKKDKSFPVTGHGGP